MQLRTRRASIACLVLGLVGCGGANAEPPKLIATAPKASAPEPSPPSPAFVPSPKGTLVFRTFTPAFELRARRPLVPMPTAIVPPTGSGTVDESGDETKLQDILIGTSPAASEKGKAIDDDVSSVKDGVRLVLDSPYQMFRKTGTYVHVAAYTPTFAPASGARVFVDGKWVGLADTNGTFVFRDVPEELSYGGGKHNLAVIAGTGTSRLKGGATYHAYGRTMSFERANLFVYTDRGVLAPGETLHVRALAWRLRGDYRPFADAAVNVMLRKEGKLLSGGRIATDKMGVATLDLPLPATLPEGSYELAVEHLGERATARLQLKRILAPVFKIEHTLPRFLSRVDKPIAFEVKLSSANGDPLKATALLVTARDPGGKTIWSETRAVTTPGPHKLVLPGDKVKLLHTGFSDGELSSVVVEATDEATGRRDELKRDLRIATTPYRLVVESDRNEHVTGESLKVVVHATDLEQAPVAGEDVEITMRSGAGQKSFVVKSDAEGLAKATFVMPGDAVVLEAKLVKTPAVTASSWVSNSPPRAMFADVAVASVTERAKTPIEVRFPSRWAPAEKVVHADIVDSSGALIHSFLIPITKEKNDWIARSSFPAPSWGSMLITFFAVGAEEKELSHPDRIGLLTDGANLPVVASRPITVTLKAPALVAPGASLDIDVSVARAFADAPKDRPFAIGASITEDALLALLDPLERTPKSVLYNPERKVMASTGSQILSWPVVQKTWGSWGSTYDIALPPFGFRMGGPPLPPVIVTSPPPPPAPPAPPTPVAPVPTATTKPSATAKPTFVSPPLKPKPGDKDGDGIPDVKDKCPNDPEDFDGFEDDDGCPDPDNDHDGILDSVDKCPNEPETYNGYQDEDGCPDKGKVIVSSNQIVILPKGAPAASPAAPPPPPPKPQEPKKPEVKLTLRTDFSPTSLWLPERILEPGKDGVASTKIAAKLSDALTTQRVTVVASDDRGALGIGKALIKVDQDLSVRSDVPAVLTHGDEVEVSVSVRNARKDAVTGTVSLVSAGITILGTGSQPLSVAGNATVAAKFKVRATTAGKVPFTVAFLETRPVGASTTAPLRDDRESRTVWVRPRGAPVESKNTGTLTSATGWAFDVERRADDLHLETDLAIAFPSAVPLLEGLEELLDHDAYLGADPDASRLLSAIAIEGYLLRTKAPQATVARVHAQLQLATTALLLEQQPDGGWGWRWDTWAAQHGYGPATSPYVTTHALLALTKLRETDIPVPESSIAAARSYLLTALDASGEVDVSNVAFWEGDGPSKRRTATMSAFQAIAASERVHKPSAAERAKIEPLAMKASAIANGGPGSEDPLTLSSAVMGLHLHALAWGRVDETNVVAGVQKLLAAYRDSYWEPSWFHAFGGRIEATRGAIELLTTVAPGVYEADLHDAVAYLLSTRSSWGAWHNAWGTAAAIEALTFLDPTPVEKAGASVTISVDGKPVKVVKIDPADPFTSAASLRMVDLTPHVSMGKHEVRIAYDGTQSVPITATVRRWTPAKPKLMLEIERALSGELSQGATVTSTIKIVTTAPRPEVLLSIPLAAGLEVDAKKMDALVASNVIAAWRTVEGGVVLSLKAVPAGSKSIDLPLRAVRKGTFTLPPVHAFVPRSEAEGYSAEWKILVK